MGFQYLDNSYLFDTTLHHAEAVLRQNLYPVTMNGLLYRRTVPSKHYYAHQWNWDSAVHAMALVHVDEKRAVEELLSLLSGQWNNGLLPHMIFNSSEEHYFPGPAFWGTEKFVKGEINTSGITQPPLVGMSLGYIAKALAGRHEYQPAIDEMLSSVLRYHDHLKRYRDPEDSGLLSIVHPWEAGNDNSPLWDEAFSEISIEKIPHEIKHDVDVFRSDINKVKKVERPVQDFYYRAMYLVWLFKSWGWDYDVIIKKSPFAMKDALFNSIWVRSNEAVAELLEERGKTEDSRKYSSWAQQTQKALALTWNDSFQQYVDIDVVHKRNVSEATNSMFAPLLARVPDEAQLKKLLDRLSDPREFWTPYPVPTTSLKSSCFERNRYWRGPSWPIINLFIIEGLDRYLANEDAKRLRDQLLEKTLGMIIRQGFFEYFDPVDGTGLGFGDFSWSAAIYIYLYHKYVKKSIGRSGRT